MTNDWWLEERLALAIAPLGKSNQLYAAIGGYGTRRSMHHYAADQPGCIRRCMSSYSTVVGASLCKLTCCPVLPCTAFRIDLSIAADPLVCWLSILLDYGAINLYQSLYALIIHNVSHS